MRLKRIVSIFISLLILCLSVTGCWKTSDSTYFNSNYGQIYFFDVGQADSSLVIFPDGTVMLIDCGNNADGDKIADFIEDLGIDDIDYLVLTHPHEDHIGGAVDIFKHFNIKTVCVPKIDSSYLSDTKTYQNLVKAISDEHCKELTLTSNTIILKKDNINISTIAPREQSIYSNLNDYSLCLKVNCFTNTILFMGDSEKPSELDILSEKHSIDADILKVGHHGSKTASSNDFLKAATPQVAVISCGKGNTYGHPHSETISRLNKLNIQTYRTDTVGTVIAKCYNGGFNIETDRNIHLDGNKE